MGVTMLILTSLFFYAALCKAMQPVTFSFVIRNNLPLAMIQAFFEGKGLQVAKEYLEAQLIDEHAFNLKEFAEFVSPDKSIDRFLALGKPLFICLASEGRLKRFHLAMPKHEQWEPTDASELLLVYLKSGAGLAGFIRTFFELFLKALLVDVAPIFNECSQEDKELLCWSGPGYKALYPEGSYHSSVLKKMEATVPSETQLIVLMAAPEYLDWSDRKNILDRLMRHAVNPAFDKYCVGFLNLVFQKFALTDIEVMQYQERIGSLAPYLMSKYWYHMKYRKLMDRSRSLSLDDFSKIIGLAHLYTIFHFPWARSKLLDSFHQLRDDQTGHIKISGNFTSEIRDAAYIVTMYNPEMKLCNGRTPETAVILKVVIFRGFHELYNTLMENVENLTDDEQIRAIIQTLMPLIKTSKGDLQVFIRTYVETMSNDQDFKFLCALFSEDRNIRSSLFEQATKDEDYFLAKFIGHIMIQAVDISAIDLVKRFLPLKRLEILDEYTIAYDVNPAELYMSIPVNVDVIKIFDTIYGCFESLSDILIPHEGNLIVKISIFICNPKVASQVRRYLPFFGIWSPFKIIHFLDRLINNDITYSFCIQ